MFDKIILLNLIRKYNINKNIDCILHQIHKQVGTYTITYVPIYKQGSRKHARSRVCFSLLVIAENKLQCITV